MANEWQDQLRIEAVETNARLEHLCNFIDGDIYPGMTPIDKVLVTAQRDALSDYLGALLARIQNFDD